MDLMRNLILLLSLLEIASSLSCNSGSVIQLASTGCTSMPPQPMTTSMECPASATKCSTLEMVMEQKGCTMGMAMGLCHVEPSMTCDAFKAPMEKMYKIISDSCTTCEGDNCNTLKAPDPEKAAGGNGGSGETKGGKAGSGPPKSCIVDIESKRTGCPAALPDTSQSGSVRCPEGTTHCLTYSFIDKAGGSCISASATGWCSTAGTNDCEYYKKMYVEDMNPPMHQFECSVCEGDDCNTVKPPTEGGGGGGGDGSSPPSTTSSAQAAPLGVLAALAAVSAM